MNKVLQASISVIMLVRIPLDAVELQSWVAAQYEDFADISLDRVDVLPDSLMVLSPLDEDFNLALGRVVLDEFGRRVPLAEGKIDAGASEWLSGTPNVYGRHFTVDLGHDRAITRIRLLAGGSAHIQPEYFIRGYRLEAAVQRMPNVWRLLAEERTNLALNVDTHQDGTWAERDENGAALPRLGRFVRLTLIRQDRSNWVALGEIEVYGTGFSEVGTAIGQFTSEVPVNVGRIRWEVETPEGTQVRLQFRGDRDGERWTNWEEVGSQAVSGLLFAGSEPVQALQYRAVLSTILPFSTPVLKRIEVEYDPVLVAQDVQGQVAPDTVRKAMLTPFTYTAAVELSAEDYGIDLLRLKGLPLEVDEVRINGISLSHDEMLNRGGYRWVGRPEEGEMVIELAPTARINSRATIDLDLRGIFLQDHTPLELAVGSREQAERDGFVNWQSARQATGGSWTVRALGKPPSLVSEVEVDPRPFSPLETDAVSFRFVVGNLQQPGEIVLNLFTLDGRRVQQLVQTGTARPYHFLWDGRNRNGRTVEPGLYLYEIRVEAGSHVGSRTGVVAVAY